MKNEHNKNEALRGPLMFTIPACGFVVAPKLDWLYKINRVADHTKKLTVTHARDLDLALIDLSNLVATRRIFQ